MLSLLLLVIAVALVFEYINGFHDTANSIATVVATKVLTPSQAILLAASTNLLGAMWGTAVAKTIASGLIDTNVVEVTSPILICALLGAIVWNLITWYVGLPSSSSHSLIGGLCGAALAASHNRWSALIWSQPATPWWTGKGLLWKVLVPMVTSPVAGFVIGFLVMGLLFALIAGMSNLGGTFARIVRTRRVTAFFAKAQLLSAGYMGFAHGSNDAQKTMGIIALALVAATSAGALDHVPPWLSFLRLQADSGHEMYIPLWIKLTCATTMAAGTAAGGWRIIKTLGHKMVKLDPINGFAAETSGASVILVASSLGIPVSTTHNISAAIMGVGAAKRFNAVKWTVVERMIWAWVLTIPATGCVAWCLVKALQIGGWQ
ncbi:MAG TPA: inorganic phosphate transporter [Candidatus Binatia bacterium]